MRGRYVRGNKSTRSAGQQIALSVQAHDSLSGRGFGRNLTFGDAAVAVWRHTGRGPTKPQTYMTCSAADLREWIASACRPRRATWLWCAGLGQAMSLCGFWDWLDSGRFSLFSPTQQSRMAEDAYAEEDERSRGYLCLADPPMIVSGWLDGNRLVMVDVRNWWSDYREPSDDLEARCRDLTERVQGTVALVRGLDIGVMRPTLASQAMGHWRHLKWRPQVLISDSRKESRLARASYFGARADCFWIGPRAGPIYHLDVNSIYGYLMEREALPCQVLYFVDGIGFDRGLELAKMGDCCAQVRVKTGTALPVRFGANTVSYAVGEFWTFLCGRELERAAKAGSIVAFGKLARYHLGPVCQQFACFWLQRREEWRNTGKRELEGLAKAMLCSLYGKWAAHKPGWTPIELPGEGRRWGAALWRDWRTGLTHPARIIAGQAEADLGRTLNVLPVYHPVPLHGGNPPARDVETESSFPAISAFITSAARAHMDDLRCIAGPNNVLYQCYDALHVTALGLERIGDAGLINPTEPGRLKVKGRYSQVVYHGVNCLRVDGQLQWAGLPSNFREMADGRVESTVFERVESVLHRGPDGTVRVQSGSWKPPPNPWGQYASIGCWRAPRKIGGE